MNIAITPELEQMVNDKVKSGTYQSAGDVVLEALRLMHERDQQMDLLRRDIRAGFEAVDRGEFTEYDESNIMKISARVHERGLQRLARESVIAGKL